MNGYEGLIRKKATKISRNALASVSGKIGANAQRLMCNYATYFERALRELASSHAVLGCLPVFQVIVQKSDSISSGPVDNFGQNVRDSDWLDFLLPIGILANPTTVELAIGILASPTTEK